MNTDSNHRFRIALVALFLAGAPSIVLAGEVCGNGIIEGGEECDDGGLLDLDGCTRTCRYEAIQRIDDLDIEGDPAPAFCNPTTNALGGAFSGIALPQVNDMLQTSIDDDSLVMLLDLLDLDTADGLNDAAIEVGLLSGSRDPGSPAPGGFDDWYLVRETLLGADGRPTETLSPGSISALALEAGPTTVALPFLDGALTIRDGSLQALVSSTTSEPGPPPTVVAPGLTAFERLHADGSSAGICGNTTVGSLAAIPVPPIPCNAACSNSMEYVTCVDEVDPSCHSLLDLLVGGCRTDLVTTNDCLLPIVSPTQPDVGVGGAPDFLVFGPSGGGIDKVVVTEPDDAYSSWFTFTSIRVHAINNLGAIFRDGFENGNTSAWD